MRRWLYLHLTLEGRDERRMAREFWHETPWRTHQGVCLRCSWRRVTGRNSRELAAHIERRREIMAALAKTKEAPAQPEG